MCPERGREATQNLTLLVGARARQELLPTTRCWFLVRRAADRRGRAESLAARGLALADTGLADAHGSATAPNA